jgi:hypothetical protein
VGWENATPLTAALIATTVGAIERRAEVVRVMKVSPKRRSPGSAARREVCRQNRVRRPVGHPLVAQPGGHLAGDIDEARTRGPEGEGVLGLAHVGLSWAR